jgi:hypothetical protein
MCIIVWQPRGIALSEETIKTCWQNNSDGAGIMYVHKGAVKIVKELKRVEQFLRLHRRAVEETESDLILHFRIATSGNMAFCHNGILDIDVPKKSTISDTILFKNQILKSLPRGWVSNSAIIELLEYYIGDSRMAFLNSRGEILILNQYRGISEAGIWYSNHSFKPMMLPRHFNFEGWKSDLKYYAANMEELKIDKEEICEECGSSLGTVEEKQMGYCETCFQKYTFVLN